MPVELPIALVEFILLGPPDDRRQLQDSPILGDVWVEFARQPDRALDLLITPYLTCPAGTVAVALQQRFEDLADKQESDPRISYVQGIVAAKLGIRPLLRLVVPMTYWFADRWIRDKRGKFTGHQLLEYGDPQAAFEVVKSAIDAANNHFGKRTSSQPNVGFPKNVIDRYAVLTALMLWAGTTRRNIQVDLRVPIAGRVLDVLVAANPQEIADELSRLVATMAQDPQVDKPLVWQISLNRVAKLALGKSVAAVKGDAATGLFNVDCRDIAWAVLDSGIDGRHPAFSNQINGRNRVRRCFDFTKYRNIVNLSNSNPTIRGINLSSLLASQSDLVSFSTAQRKDQRKFAKTSDGDLKELAEDARRGGAIDWELVQKFVEIKPETPPVSSHGTHVAGIIGASKDAAKEKDFDRCDIADGMCPNITLYDFRVVGTSLEDTEFAIIAALQFIRFLNDSNNFMTIHGANLSLSIPHDVRNFACGNTPVCIESERLVDSGVVVVAAAGNHGHKSFETKDGSFESYAAFSITDPGNADSVITVGSTHRHWPHTYGVSFFSSRGPTGDGRLKPDLVAPGERIRAPLLNGQWGDLDGTSMAAPHVSGAAAMLMARYSELIGRPRKIKQILCQNATDLNRERSFQGHGMLDVLRAFQSI